MIDYSKLKPKRMKWLEISLFLALLLIGIIFLAYMGLKDTPDSTQLVGTELVEPENNGSGLWTAIYIISAIGTVGIVGYFITRTKSLPPSMTDGEIIKFVADEIYNEEEALILKTRLNNVNVQRNAPGEWYVEFKKEAITFLFLQGSGIVERYPGMSIDSINERKSNDKIQMKLADIGIAKKKHIETMEKYGLTEEEV